MATNCTSLVDPSFLSVFANCWVLVNKLNHVCLSHSFQEILHNFAKMWIPNYHLTINRSAHIQ
jgi:hypothetical protein